MFILFYLIIGCLFLMVPHFLLPIQLIEAGRSGWVTTECSWYYHPSWLIALVIIVGALIAINNKRGSWIIATGAVLGLFQGLALKPLSFFFRTEEKLIILGQTISLRAHSGIRVTLLILSSLVIIGLIAEILLNRLNYGQPTLYSLPFANLRRKRFRTAALVCSLAVVIGAFFADVLLTRSIGNTLEVGVGRLGADVVVVPKDHTKDAESILLEGTPHSFFMKESYVSELKKLPEVDKLSPQIFFRPFSYLVCCVTEQVLIIGYDPSTDFTIGPWIQYFLNKGQANHELVVGARVKFYPGQQITMFGTVLNVVASLDFSGLGYFDKTAFMPIEGARALIRQLKDNEKSNLLHTRDESSDLSMTHLYEDKSTQESELKDIDPEGISSILIKVKDSVDVKAFAETIPKLFPELAVVNVRSATLSIKRQLTSMLDAFFLPIIILIFMGTVILAAIFGMSANERRREVGLLRAVGATQLKVFQLFLAESCLVAILGCVFGILGGSALLILFKHKIMASLSLLYIWPSPWAIFQVAVMTLGVAAFVGIAAGLYPAIKAARLEPYEAFRSNQI